ncbi:MAG: hypothetical protein EBR82_53870 [Caulobacteraceae bacterium]|nr:hypothetical protein [Caulobacteraceae bacterium]NDC26045.1 hypothetical protein [Pseudomonadota bacterium]NDD04553.1 hypothetical protein [Pseudomonadota bacterium]
MKIDTDDWVTLAEACALAGLPTSTGYRIAKRLGVVKVVFGVRVVRKADIPRIKEDQKARGNPDWIASYDAAADASLRAVESRMKRIAADGLTEAEKTRGEKIKASRAAKR